MAIKGGNIFTEDIADMLGVTETVALRVHNHIDKFYPVDWSEATDEEIRLATMLAFEDLNQEVPADFM